MLDEDPSRWTKREGDRTLIGCRGSEEKWETICDGKTWRGIEEFNCSAPGECLMLITDDNNNNKNNINNNRYMYNKYINNYY